MVVGVKEFCVDFSLGVDRCWLAWEGRLIVDGRVVLVRRKWYEFYRRVSGLEWDHGLEDGCAMCFSRSSQIKRVGPRGSTLDWGPWIWGNKPYTG